MTLAWIVWRDMEEVRRWDPQWLNEHAGSEPLLPWRKRGPTFHFNAKYFEVWGYLSSYREDGKNVALANATPEASSRYVKQAKSDLWKALAEGRLQSYAIPSSGQHRIKIPPHEWVDLSNRPKSSALIGIAQRQSDDDYLCTRHERSKIYYKNPLFLADEVRICFSQIDAPKGTVNEERQAERELKELAERFQAGQGEIPVRARWVESCGLGPRPAERVWRKVAADHPELSSRKKPKRKRSA